MNEPRAYVFKPRSSSTASRKRNIEALEDHQNEAPLAERKKTFHTLWPPKQEEITDILKDAYRTIVARINEFITASSTTQSAKVPLGLIVTGQGDTAQDRLYSQLADALKADGQLLFVLLDSADCTTLKSLLKTLIRRATNVIYENDDDEGEDQGTTETARRPSGLLNYDLEILHSFCAANSVKKVVVAFRDAEAFDPFVLSEIILLFKSWKPSIDFVPLFGIATSPDILQDRLTRTAISSVHGRLFSVAEFDRLLKKTFAATMSRGSAFWFGPAVIDLLLSRQVDLVQSIERFVQSIKHTYMSHCYGNVASAFLLPHGQWTPLPFHFEAIRHLPSFRLHVEELIKQKQAPHAKALLESDTALLQEVESSVQKNRDLIAWLVGAVEILDIILSTTRTEVKKDFSSLYCKALKNELKTSAVLRECMIHTRRIAADTLQSLLPKVADVLITMPPREDVLSPDDLTDISDQLDKLIDESKAAGRTLQGEHELKQETFRTTIVAQRVELSKQTAQLSKQDTAYSELVKQFHDILLELFDDAFIDYKQLFLHEILIYDLRVPQREAFMPKPRHVIERALSMPHDYLGCECCASHGEMDATQPPTSILYQLYLETGAIINAADLYSAFSNVVKDQYDEQVKSALFARGLAELKYLGFVKPSRKKADHLAKLAWKGL